MDAKLTLTLSNNDNAIGTLCLADGVGNRNIRLWKFTGNAPSLTDCSQIFGGIGDTFSLTKRRVTIQAVPKGWRSSKSHPCASCETRCVPNSRQPVRGFRGTAKSSSCRTEHGNLSIAKADLRKRPAAPGRHRRGRRRRRLAVVRQMYPADKYAFTVTHVVNRQRKKSTLEAFYAANKALPFDFVFRDELTTTYTGCVFIKSPQYKLIARGVGALRCRSGSNERGSRHHNRPGRRQPAAG